MTQTDSLDRTRESLARHLADAHAARARAAAHPLSASQRAKVRAWQAQRLAATHADLLGSPRYGDAARFFLTDLYSVGDTTERDRELERALPSMMRLLPAAALEPLALALEADALAEQLDALLGEKLFAVGIDVEVDAPRYAAAYRACDNRADRERQIRLIDSVGRRLDRIAVKPMLATTVRLMRQPAAAAGFGALQAFLERGLTAFKAMGGAGPFLDRIATRERAIMERLFRGDGAPFDVAGVDASDPSQ